MNLAGRSSVAVSQRHVHLSPPAVEDAAFRLDRMNMRSLESERQNENENERGC